MRPPNPTKQNQNTVFFYSFFIHMYSDSCLSQQTYGNLYSDLYFYLVSIYLYGYPPFQISTMGALPLAWWLVRPTLNRKTQSQHQIACLLKKIIYVNICTISRFKTGTNWIFTICSFNLHL